MAVCTPEHPTGGPTTRTLQVRLKRCDAPRPRKSQKRNVLPGSLCCSMLIRCRGRRQDGRYSRIRCNKAGAESPVPKSKAMETRFQVKGPAVSATCDDEADGGAIEELKAWVWPEVAKHCLGCNATWNCSARLPLCDKSGQYPIHRSMDGRAFRWFVG